MLTVRQVAQSSLAFHGKPGEAKDETRYVFINKSVKGLVKSYYDSTFPEGITARKLFLTWEIYRRVDERAKEALREVVKEAEKAKLQGERGGELPLTKDHLLFGRFHTTWLVGILLTKGFGNIHPEMAQALVQRIDKWFPLAYNVARKSLESAVTHTRREEGQRYTHRSFFRESRYYKVLQDYLDEEIKDEKDIRQVDVIETIRMALA